MIKEWPDCTKKQYSKKDAQTMRNTRKNSRQGKRQKQLYIYPCHYCGWWHLTREKVSIGKTGFRRYNQ